ncbi:chaplin [Streptomyces beihaiensis]|uniref:Chaplin n=1 Tax=Streptomyces beihaiensis TaxID=2984495 RepID=A0ABT3TTT6_9ACTN|nr:chaplin [Streptomyces beihaiensis]MCX3059443.1 chaplin [Streptomyces beihaiensis]
MRLRAFAAAAVLAGTSVLGSAAVASALDGPGGGASAQGFVAGSPGVLSGNLVQVPIDVPINACGNSLDLIAALNPAFGNTCVNR